MLKRSFKSGLNTLSETIKAPAKRQLLSTRLASARDFSTNSAMGGSMGQAASSALELNMGDQKTYWEIENRTSISFSVDDQAGIL